jgi:hypothetical protein
MAGDGVDDAPALRPPRSASLAFIKAELMITDAQTAQWNAFAEAVRANAATMSEHGFDQLTYRKGRCPRINERRFVRRRAKLDGRRVDHLQHDQRVRLLKGNLRLRQVTPLCDTGHQTQVITSRWDLHIENELGWRASVRAQTDGAILSQTEVAS